MHKPAVLNNTINAPVKFFMEAGVCLSDITPTLQEKGRISALQLGFLIVTFVIATSDVFLPGFVYEEAAQDSWLSVLIGTAASILLVLVFLQLGLDHPDRTFIQYTCDILGKPLGKAAGLFYVYFFINLCEAVTRELSEILVIAFNPVAPIFVYNLVTLLVAAYAVSRGLEVIARVNQILLPAGITILVLITFVNLPNMDLVNYMPVLAAGLAPPLRGSVLIQAWILESFFILQLIPYVKEKNKIRKYTIFSILIIGMGLMLGITIIAVFGPLTGKLLFPALEFVRFAKIGKYLQNLDITIMGVWLTGIFVKVTVALYISLQSLVQVFEIKGSNHLIIPMVILVLALSSAPARVVEIYHFAHYILPFYTFFAAFIIPSLILLVSKLRKNRPNPGGGN